LIWASLLVFATIVVGGGLDARRRLPDLEAWHRIVPRDVRASDLTPTSTLADYLAPTAHEVPTIELHHRETPSTQSLTRAKGLGEGGGIGAPAAVVNAINDALSPFGVEIDEMPATPQRIRAALRAAKS